MFEFAKLPDNSICLNDEYGGSNMLKLNLNRFSLRNWPKVSILPREGVEAALEPSLEDDEDPELSKLRRFSTK